MRNAVSEYERPGIMGLLSHAKSRQSNDAFSVHLSLSQFDVVDWQVAVSLFADLIVNVV